MNCLWKEFDSWCKCTQCLKHAIALNPDVYSLDDPSPIEAIRATNAKVVDISHI